MASSSDSTLGLYIYCNQPLTDYTNIWLELKEIKLEKGNMATAWTPAQEDIDNEIQEAKDEALQVSTALNSTESLLNKSLEDGYIDANEKEALKKALATLTVEMSDIEKEYTDVYNSKYLTTTQKFILYGFYNDLSKNYDTYKSAIENIINKVAISGLTLAKTKIKISEKISNWNFTTN